MHEVGIAKSIYEIIESEAKKNNAGKVVKVKLLIGEFTGIVKEALEFALDVIKKGSFMEDTEFEIETVKLKTYCSNCDKTFIGKSNARFLCPDCQNILSIKSGKEMEIEYIDIV